MREKWHSAVRNLSSGIATEFAVGCPRTVRKFDLVIRLLWAHIYTSTEFTEEGVKP